MEPTMFTGWVHDDLMRRSPHVKVAHPAMLKAISAGKKKNDRVDAQKISDLLRCNYFTESISQELQHEMRKVSIGALAKEAGVTERTVKAARRNDRLQKATIAKLSTNKLNLIVGRTLNRALVDHGLPQQISCFDWHPRRILWLALLFSDFGFRVTFDGDEAQAGACFVASANRCLPSYQYGYYNLSLISFRRSLLRFRDASCPHFPAYWRMRKNNSAKYFEPARSEVREKQSILFV
jgi:hypothetical protein